MDSRSGWNLWVSLTEAGVGVVGVAGIYGCG